MSEQQAEYKVSGRTEIRQGCLLPFADPGYETPSADEVRELLRRASLTGSAAAKIAGVSGRSVRKWTGGETKIQYAPWRLLLLYAGLAREDEHLMAAE